VKRHLPWERQDDIIAELKANLESQLEDKEAELGRPLTKDEMEAWLKQIGSPMQVAGRYLPQRYLIGPAIFPMYLYVLRLACFWCIVISAVVSGVLILDKATVSDSDFVMALLRLPEVLMTTAAWVTLVFAAIEFGVKRNPQKYGPLAGAPAEWSPAALPPVGAGAAAGKKPRSFAQAAAEVIFGFLFLVWLLLLPANPWLLLGPGALYLRSFPYQLAPVWVQFYWCVVGLNVLHLVWSSVMLARGTWQKPQPKQHIAMKAIGLIPVLVLVFASGHTYLVLKSAGVDPAFHGASVDAINQGIYRAGLLACFISVLQLLWAAWRLGRELYRARVTGR
jgi:hypothetical protein